MAHRIGDTVFSPNGVPGVVTKREAGLLEVQTSGKQLDITRKRGYINGLSVAERTEFNQAVDSVRKIANPKERVQELSKMIQELKADPSKITVARYLEAEMAHIMMTHEIQPTEYRVDADLVRT